MSGNTGSTGNTGSISYSTYMNGYFCLDFTQNWGEVISKALGPTSNVWNNYYSELYYPKIKGPTDYSEFPVSTKDNNGSGNINNIVLVDSTGVLAQSTINNEIVYGVVNNTVAYTGVSNGYNLNYSTWGISNANLGGDTGSTGSNSDNQIPGFTYPNTQVSYSTLYSDRNNYYQNVYIANGYYNVALDFADNSNGYYINNWTIPIDGGYIDWVFIYGSDNFPSNNINFGVNNQNSINLANANIFGSGSTNPFTAANSTVNNAFFKPDNDTNLFTGQSAACGYMYIGYNINTTIITTIPAPLTNILGAGYFCTDLSEDWGKLLFNVNGSNYIVNQIDNSNDYGDKIETTEFLNNVNINNINLFYTNPINPIMANIEFPINQSSNGDGEYKSYYLSININSSTNGTILSSSGGVDQYTNNDVITIPVEPSSSNATQFYQTLSYTTPNDPMASLGSSKSVTKKGLIQSSLTYNIVQGPVYTLSQSSSQTGNVIYDYQITWGQGSPPPNLLDSNGIQIYTYFNNINTVNNGILTNLQIDNTLNPFITPIGTKSPLGNQYPGMISAANNEYTWEQIYSGTAGKYNTSSGSINATGWMIISTNAPLSIN